jgi:hypothetical protein
MSQFVLRSMTATATGHPGTYYKLGGWQEAIARLIQPDNSVLHMKKERRTQRDLPLHLVASPKMQMRSCLDSHFREKKNTSRTRLLGACQTSVQSMQ